MSRYVNPVPQYYLNDGSVASSGKLYFYENKDPNTKKDTFSDAGETIKNTNPVLLDGEGRCPPIFGTGRYTVVLKSSQNIQQWSRDDVDLTSVLGQFADWSAIITYRMNDIARGSDGNYYSSIVSNNLGNDPISSPTLWEELAFLTIWNSSSTYSEDDIVVHDGVFYRSAINDNLNNQPDSSSTFEWADTSSPRDWISARTYNDGDIVVHNSSIWASTSNDNTGQEPGLVASSWNNVSSSGDIVQLSGSSSTITDNFNGTYVWNGSGGHSLSIGLNSIDEGATETIIICDPSSTSNITISFVIGVSLEWSFTAPPGTVDGYEVKPGETLRLVRVDLNSYRVYADNGISETVELGGEFDPDQKIRITRNGNIVNIYTIGSISGNVTHSSQSIASSAIVVPEIYRPKLPQVENVYSINSSISTDSVNMIRVHDDGHISLVYMDWAGSFTNQTDSGGTASISYDINNG